MAIIQGNAKQGSTRGFYPKVINGSLRFNDDDSAYLSWTPASAGNRKTFTISVWVKRGNISASSFYPYIFDGGTANEHKLAFVNDQLSYGAWNGSDEFNLTTSQVFRDPSAWYHIVVAQDTAQATAADRVNIYINGEEVTSWSTGNYPTQNWEGRINNTNEHAIGRWQGGTSRYLDGYLANVHFIDGQALTASDFGSLKNGVWVAEDYAGTFGTNGFYLTFEDDTEVEAFNTVLYRSQQPSLGVTGVGFKPDLVITKTRGISSGSTVMDSVRGTSAMLSTASTGAESTTGGKGIISFDSDGFTLGTDADIGSSNYSNGTDYVAWCWDAGANNAVTGHSSVTYTGNGTDNHRISGLPFTPDLIWGKKRSAAGSHFLLDSVRGVNSTLSSDTTGTEDTTADIFRGFDKDGFILGSNGQSNSSGVTYIAWAWDAGDGDPVSNTAGSITSTVKASQANGFSIVSYQGTLADANIGHGLSSAPDMVIIKNRNRSAGTPWVIYHSALGASQRLVFTNDIASSSGNIFGSTPTAPDATRFYVGNVNWVNNNVSGENDHIAYCFHDVTGKQKFGSYEGNNTATGPTVNLGFRPGFVMIKNADGTGNWNIFDGSRFPFANNDLFLRANLNAAEVDGSGEGADAYEVEFTSTGFIPKASGASSRSQVNGTGTYIYAAFAGSYSDYITDYNTDGSIDSRVKANDTTGFSIVSYKGNGANGATVGHGLSGAPDFVITKTRTQAENWNVQHVDSQRLNLNTNGAQVNNYLMTFNASTVTLTDLTYQNGNGYDMIMYAWKETTGYSKFGSYTGTGVAGNAVTGLGFTPSLIMIKRTDSTGDWIMVDNTRGSTSILRSNLSNAESVGYWGVESQSDGFEITISRSETNASGGTYIYAAFADTREAAFWLDQSGNDNDWQPVNLDHNDTVADSPTNNFCTLNPVIRFYSSSSTLSDGNLKFNANATGVTESAFATFPMTSGQWYAECTINSTATGQWIGVSSNLDAAGRGTYAGGVRNPGYAYKVSDGNKCNNSNTGVSYGPSSTVGDVIGIAMDADNGSIEFFKNGSSMGVAFTGMTSTGDNGWVFGADSDSGGSFTWNFGQQPFKYDPPA